MEENLLGGFRMMLRLILFKCWHLREHGSTWTLKPGCLCPRLIEASLTGLFRLSLTCIVSFHHPAVITASVEFGDWLRRSLCLVCQCSSLELGSGRRFFFDIHAGRWLKPLCAACMWITLLWCSSERISLERNVSIILRRL